MRDELTFCTGTLIDHDLILTAAHCFEKTINAEGAALAHIRVVAGSGGTAPGPKMTAEIIEAKIHPMYWQDQRGAMDFAWVKVHPPFISVPPASMPSSRTELEHDLAQALASHDTAEIVGFGLTSRTPQDGAENIGQKHQAQIPFAYRTGVELFAGSSSADTCLGDSGGPLFLKVPKTTTNPTGLQLAGVTSRGPMPCAADFGYGAYGLTSETLCWLRASAAWHHDAPDLTDFCIRELARGTSAPLDPVVMKRSFAEACMSNDLLEDSRHDLQRLMDIANVSQQNLSDRCNQLENFLGSVQTLDLAANQIRQISWLRFANKLQDLDAHDNMIVDIAPLLSLPSLKHADLRNNRISDIKSLQKLAQTVHVLGFRTQWTTIDDTHYRELAERGAALSAEKRALVIALRELLVDGSIARKSRDLALKRHINVDRRGVRSLEAIRGLENLEALSLIHNSDITDWEELLTLPKLSHLRIDAENRMPELIAEKLRERGVIIER